MLLPNTHASPTDSTDHNASRRDAPTNTSLDQSEQTGKNHKQNEPSPAQKPDLSPIPTIQDLTNLSPTQATPHKTTHSDSDNAQTHAPPARTPTTRSDTKTYTDTATDTDTDKDHFLTRIHGMHTNIEELLEFIRQGFVTGDEARVVYNVIADHHDFMHELARQAEGQLEAEQALKAEEALRAEEAKAEGLRRAD